MKVGRTEEEQAVGRRGNDTGRIGRETKGRVGVGEVRRKAQESPLEERYGRGKGIGARG